MKVLMTGDAVGGVWTYAMELSAALAEDGVEMLLAVMGPAPSGAQRREAQRHGNLILAHEQYRLEWMDEPWEDVRRAGQWLLELEQAYHPDVIHLNGYAHGALPWLAPVLVVAHSCVLSWWEAVKHEAAPTQWGRYRHAVASGLASADCVVAPSRAMLSTIQRDYGPFANAHVIANARDPAGFSSLAKESFIFCAGRLWDEAKNLEALRTVQPEIAWPIYIAGNEESSAHKDRPAGTSARAQTRPGEGQAALKRLGRLNGREVAQWMARASIYALPARYEPFGLSALEAGLCGCALVMGDIPSLREIWAEAGVFVEPEDHEALKRALNELIADRGRREQLGIAARRRALSYSPRRMADAYVHQYRAMGGSADTSASYVSSGIQRPIL